MTDPRNPGNPNLNADVALQMGNLLAKLSSHPKTRDLQLELIQMAEPGYKMPADVAVKKLEEKLRAERAAEKRAEQEERAKNRRARSRGELVKSHGEDVVKAIEEKWLKKYPHLDYEDAAKLHAAEDAPVRPTGVPATKFRHGQIWEFPDLPGLLQNADKAATDAAYSIIDEMNAARR